MTSTGLALTPRERDVLVAMISRATDFDGVTVVDPVDRERWLAQVPGTRTGRRCGCGECPSVVLLDASGRTPTGERSRIVLSAGAPEALLLLFVDDDRLSYLELAPTEPDGRFEEFPPVESLRFGPAEP